MPTYSGGLGVLAGDTLRSAADLGVPLVAFTLVHRKGYFQQHLDENGAQSEEIQPWNPADFCTEEPARVTVSVEGRIVTGALPGAMTWWAASATWCPSICWIRIWKETRAGIADSPITCTAATPTTALQQEIVLGMGGARMANALGYSVNVYHMNEGHAALLTLALLERQLGGGPLNGATEADIEEVRNSASSPLILRFRPAMTASPPSRPFASSAATARRASK